MTDVASQPGDVSFLIDRVLGFSEQTLLLASHPTLGDPRIGAAMPIVAVSSFFAEGFLLQEIPRGPAVTLE